MKTKGTSRLDLCRVVVPVTAQHDNHCSLQAYMRLPVSQYVLMDVRLPHFSRCTDTFSGPSALQHSMQAVICTERQRRGLGMCLSSQLKNPFALDGS